MAALTTLKEWATAGQLSNVTFSEDGQSLSYGGQSISATGMASVADGCTYSVGAMFLQILDPDQGLLQYRKECKKYNVQDPVKALDKATVVSYFLPDQAAPAPAPPPAAVAAAAATAPSDRKKSKKEDRHRHHHHKKDRRSSSSGKKRPSSEHHGSSKKKKAYKAIDNQSVLTNLNVVVDKRQQKLVLDEANKQTLQVLHQALDPTGFGVTPDLLEKYREQTEKLTAWEIPVGDSSSILQASAGKDLSRVLKLYMESLPSSKSSSKKSKSTASAVKKPVRSYLIGQRPIIIVPKGMTAPLTLLNAHEFFCNRRFAPRDVLLREGKVQKHNPPTIFTRQVPPRLGGGMVEYEIIDNPKQKLKTKQDWERVVAVVVLGAAWQFKDWPGPYKEPASLFGQYTYGFFVGIEGDKIPAEVPGWAVTTAQLNRDKRGLDSVTYASFWNGLDEFMAIHKSELLPQPVD